MLAHMKQTSELILPRCYCLNGITDPVVNIKLHGFSDASEVAYIGCFHIKVAMQRECTEVSLVTAKSCIMPNSKKETSCFEIEF